MTTARTLALGFAAALLLLALAAAGVARANGVPQLVKLSYLEGVSNWGPEDAEGTVEFSLAEAFARVEVKRLLPSEGHELEAWLLGPESAAVYVGPVTVDETGSGGFEGSIEGLDPAGTYDLFVVAARAEGDPEETVPSARSIAGHFEIIDDVSEDNPGDARPVNLPETGEAPPGPFDGRLLWTLTAMAGVAAGAGAGAYAKRIRGGAR